jgi:STE24 endopeptidase
MTAGTVLAIYLAFFAAEFLFESGLTCLNVNHIKKNREKVPEQLAGYFSREYLLRSADYSLTYARFSLASAPFHAAFVLLIVTAGFMGVVNGWIAGWGLPSIIHGVVYVFFFGLLFTVFSVPFSLYSQFVIEEKFGFNRMTVGLFFVDEMKSVVLSAVIGFPLLLGLFALIKAAPSFWWVWGFVLVTAFQLVMTVLYPVVIAPLFNKFTPLEEGSLKEKLESLAGRLSFRAKGIYIMDGSRRSAHSNAYFTGFGKAKRIVLFDTLVEKLSENQITAVLAHELGHEKLKHVLKRVIISTLITFASFFLLSLLLQFEPLFQAFGFSGPCPHCLFIIVAFCSGPFTFFLKPLLTSWSRKHEYEADRFAVEAMGEYQSLAEALVTLGKENLSNLTPHPLFSFYHYSHPSLGERVGALKAD